MAFIPPLTYNNDKEDINRLTHAASHLPTIVINKASFIHIGEGKAKELDNMSNDNFPIDA
jgi:hypothetical protein